MTATLDFSFDDDQLALRDLADRILDDFATHERMRVLEREPDWFDPDAWAALGGAGVLGAGLPEAVGGGGGGFLATAVVLESVGRHVAMVPVLASIVGGAMPIARFGDASQRSRWAAPAASGELILTAALQEPGNDDVTAPTTSADLGIDGWRLTGTKHCVPAAHLAARLLVPARAGVGTGAFLVDPEDPAVTVTRFAMTNGEVQCTITLDAAPAEPIGDPAAGAPIVRSIVEHLTTGLCLIQTGVSEQALRMTAAHVATREQFGQPVAQFQAVSQRAADAFIDTEAIRLTAWQAAWRLAAGLTAADEVAIAKFWAAEGGQRVAHAAQHLHGGVGADVDYPLRRYFTWAKVNELTLGSATRQLRTLGGRIAASHPDGVAGTLRP
ncbi:MAG: acyl-CoA dehydrogenase family protein [Actinomycetota bacterium]